VTPPPFIAGPAPGCQKIILPAYAYPVPAAFWDGGISAADPVRFIIADPDDGPGSAQDPNYVEVIGRAQAAGIRILGYVETDYGSRAERDIAADIETWKVMYGVTDIFFDETASSADLIPYYASAVGLVRATPGAIAMLNPGTNPDEGYAQVADILNVFEGSEGEYADFAPAEWMADHPSSRFSHLIYDVPDAASMTTAVALSIARGAGYVYVTSDTLPNPWSVLPDYWAAETALISEACAAGR
jgi:Spherulation-specific family 4